MNPLTADARAVASRAASEMVDHIVTAATGPAIPPDTTWLQSVNFRVVQVGRDGSRKQVRAAKRALTTGHMSAADIAAVTSRRALYTLTDAAVALAAVDTTTDPTNLAPLLAAIQTQNPTAATAKLASTLCGLPGQAARSAILDSSITRPTTDTAAAELAAICVRITHHARHHDPRLLRHTLREMLAHAV